LRGGYNWNLSRDDDFGGIEDLFLKNYTYSFSLSVNFPIFNGLSTENSVKIQKLRYLQSQEQLKQDQRNLGLEIKRVYLNLERLRKSVQANEAAVEAAQEDYNLQTERYNLGASTFLERQQSQVSLFSARSDLVQASYDYQIELARLEQALGHPPRTREDRE
jgi:outer membrane protein TolC